MSLDIATKLKDIIADYLNVSADSVVPETSFVDDLGADSLDLVELIMAFEEAFEIEIADVNVEKIVTVQDAINYVNSVIEEE